MNLYLRLYQVKSPANANGNRLILPMNSTSRVVGSFRIRILYGRIQPRVGMILKTLLLPDPPTGAKALFSEWKRHSDLCVKLQI